MASTLPRTVQQTTLFLVTILLMAGNSFGAEDILHIFRGTVGANPSSNLVFDSQGNLYGATAASGSEPCKCGTVYRLSSESGKVIYRVIYQFKGGADGGYPIGNLVFDATGNLYGVAGYNYYGQIFELSPQPDGRWVENTVYTFSGADGTEPYSGLTIDKAGNLYGTTRLGGANGMGVVYQLTPAKGGGWAETVLHSFSGKDGEYPWADVTLDQQGNVYGTTIWGGSYGHGTVFELSLSAGSWTETVLYSFQGLSQHGEPAAGVYVASTGNIYGTTSDNGEGYPGCVFSLAPSSNGGWTETVLHTFGGSGDGEFPWSDLVPDAAGSLYGTTFVGGKEDYGTIYKMTASAQGDWTESVFHSFTFADGAAPSGNPVTFDLSGNLYVATYYGGLNVGYDGDGVAIAIAAPK